MNSETAYLNEWTNDCGGTVGRVVISKMEGPWIQQIQKSAYFNSQLILTLLKQ